MHKIYLAAIGIAFTGLLNAQTVFLDEDFENGLPTGWTQSTLATDGGWNTGTAASLSSTYFPIAEHTTFIATNDDACNCNKSADSLFTDFIDLSTASGMVVMQYDLYYMELTEGTATESLEFHVYSTATNSWSLLSDVAPIPVQLVWDDGQLLDLSAYIGDVIKIAFVYNDDGGWTYGACFDNLRIFEPNQYDVVNLSVDNGQFHEVNTPATIEGTIRNMGSETITSLEISYSVDGGAAVNGTLNGLNIAPLATYSYAHPVSWNPTVTQTSTIVTTTGDVNGNNDEGPGNNTASTDVLVHGPAVPRKPLLEQFTSSTCAPCTPGNANVLNVMSNFTNEFTKINYQMSWPGSGDPYYTEEGNQRRNYYAVNSVPSMHVDGSDGTNSNSFTASIFETAQAVPAFVNLTVSGSIQPNIVYAVENGVLVADTTFELTAEAEINPVIDLPAGLIAHVSLQEDLTYNNIKSNGETEFHDVMKKMLPNANGTTLPAIGNGDTYTLPLSHTFPGVYRLPNNASSPINHAIEHSIETLDDLRLAVWVQTAGNKEVWQSENAEVELLEAIDNLETDTNESGAVVYTIDGVQYEDFNGVIAPLGTTDIFGAKVGVFPNPANDVLNITGVSSNATMVVFDAMGRMVGQHALQNNAIYTSSWTPGVYNLVITDGAQQTTKRISIVH
jgi:hypothetical protein